mmetsp:Transcript_8321/g.8484  ORF Transcript_8321/g.8484 Transcript_8321/m.8484 type:complete len:347 (-) Transcript_8321:191-1231(-)|eukprot:CAMPEP_0182422108 /NCGR_PEP_ID=MMETSP1167-20130531/7695_1 /TAXON_ID=2988 /ORGANISM="Mallomonas Sp, Strain CCMP3275" /LENGTH=346 /DNA_ID=CAMNT_0024599859 /DNA_START=180 /DNA_END=1220 /DNA_ORIENTATION=+
MNDTNDSIFSKEQIGRWNEQLEEIDVLLSMFPMDGELQINTIHLKQIENIMKTWNEFKSIQMQKESKNIRKLNFTLLLLNLEILDEIPSLYIEFPYNYPETEPLLISLLSSTLSNNQLQLYNEKLFDLASSLLGQPAALQVYQLACELVTEWRDESQRAQNTVRTSVTLATSSISTTEDNNNNNNREEEEEEEGGYITLQDPRVEASPLNREKSSLLGRRAIYFHHIIASNKRKLVMEWAVQLGLSGFSKIGWPGVVLIEGTEAGCQEYVRQLQHLRWKQMVVRGEQTEVCAPGTPLDTLRKLPLEFREFPEDGMSDLAAACRDAGIEDLFLSIMKIYERKDGKRK